MTEAGVRPCDFCRGGELGLPSGLECGSTDQESTPDYFRRQNTSTRLNLKYSISAHPLDISHLPFCSGFEARSPASY